MSGSQGQRPAISALRPQDLVGSMGRAWLVIQGGLGPKPVSPAYQPHVLGKEVTFSESMSLQAGDNNL